MEAFGVHDPWLAWGIMAGAFAAVTFASLLLLRMVARLATSTKGDVDDRIAKASYPGFALLLGLVAAGAVLGRSQGRLTGAQASGTLHSILAFAVLTIAWVVVGVMRILLEVAGKRRSRYRPATRVARRLLAVFVYTAAFLMILAQYDISITPLLTGLGIAGLAAALALQDTLGNFFAGISIQTGQALQPGHFVRLEKEKLEGYVERVGWRTTNIRTLANNSIVIPNSALAQAVVTDFYLPTPELSVDLSIVVARDVDPTKVIDAMVDEAKELMKVSDAFAPGPPGPFAQFIAIEDFGLRFQLSIRVNEFVQQLTVMHELRMRILARFQRDGIRIPYPTRHNYQEQVGPAARAKAVAKTPRQRRPPRPRAAAAAAPATPAEAAPGKPAETEVHDPHEAVAAKAREEIAAKQAQEAAKDAPPTT